ncbi:apolipoprotein F [Phalacrocorax aristotelis]|uniref:apolipoprotein F n=1 Tax=Phalacrocorax aristotelis TaxID=126867 RepID=UPI003F4C6952
MAQALLFLLLLSVGGSTLSAVPPGPAARDQAAARALLVQLAEHVPPQALPGHGVLCQDLRPEALPGFAQLPPLARALARAAMALALSGAACGPQAEAEVLGLSRELGPAAAAALLRGLAQLRGAPASKVLPLLLSLVQPCVAPTQPQGPTASAHPTPPRAPVTAEGLRVLLGARARAWLPTCGQATRHQSRHRREYEDACNPSGEEEAHRVLEWVPGVSTFYSLGTSLYYAFQGCRALASTRALEVAEDLGYASLAALAAGTGGPVALGLQLGLQPGLKAGVRALVSYFTSDGDPLPAPTAHSGPVVIV